MKIADIEDISELVGTIKKLKFYNKTIYFTRGGEYLDDDFIRGSVPKSRSRTPVDIPIEIHDAINRLTLDKYGVGVRNGLFVYARKPNIVDYSHNIYGVSRVIFPLDNCEIYFNPTVKDLYTTYRISNNSIDVEKYANGLIKITDSSQLKSIKDAEVILFGDYISVSIDKAVECGLIKAPKVDSPDEDDITSMPTSTLLFGLHRGSIQVSKKIIDELTSRIITDDDKELLGHIIISKKIFTSKKIINMLSNDRHLALETLLSSIDIKSVHGILDVLKLIDMKEPLSEIEKQTIYKIQDRVKIMNHVPTLRPALDEVSKFIVGVK